MSIETTISIKSKYLSLVTDISNQTNSSINKILCNLLKLSTIYQVKKIESCTRVKYQTSDDDTIWCTQHITLTPELYEKSIDMKKLYKLSVSYIIALAIEKYIKKCLKKANILTPTDNYENTYIIIKKYSQSFMVFWNWPGEITLLKILE